MALPYRVGNAKRQLGMSLGEHEYLSFQEQRGVVLGGGVQILELLPQMRVRRTRRDGGSAS